MPPRLSATRSSAASREHRGVERRRERRALAAGGDVAAAEVGHHADAGQFREQRRVADLRGVAALGTVPDRLAVAADGAYGRRRRVRFGQHGGDRIGVALRQFVAGQRGALDFVRAAGIQRQQFALQRARSKGRCAFASSARPGAGEVRQHRIDPVEAGARHQADVESPASLQRGDLAVGEQIELRRTAAAPGRGRRPCRGARPACRRAGAPKADCARRPRRGIHSAGAVRSPSRSARPGRSVSPCATRAPLRMPRPKAFRCA